MAKNPYMTRHAVNTFATKKNAFADRGEDRTVAPVDKKIASSSNNGRQAVYEPRLALNNKRPYYGHPDFNLIDFSQKLKKTKRRRTGHAADNF